MPGACLRIRRVGSVTDGGTAALELRHDRSFDVAVGVVDVFFTLMVVTISLPMRFDRGLGMRASPSIRLEVGANRPAVRLANREEGPPDSQLIVRQAAVGATE